jgi:hypothetical protein
MVLVKPATVVQWHRQGFRLYWRWRSARRPTSREQGNTQIDPPGTDPNVPGGEVFQHWVQFRAVALIGDRVHPNKNAIDLKQSRSDLVCGVVVIGEWFCCDVEISERLEKRI